MPETQPTDVSAVPQDPREALSGLNLEEAKAHLQSHPALLAKETVLWITDKIPIVGLENSERAERFAQIADWLAEQLDDDFCRARTRRATGHFLSRTGQHSKAAGFYSAAVDLFMKLGEESETAITLSSSLQALMYLGRYDEAFANAEQARGIFKSRGDKLRLARLDVNLGNVLNRQDRFADALVLYRRAEPVLESFRVFRDLAIVLMNIAVCSLGLFDIPSAEAAYDGARLLCSMHNMPLLAAQANYNIAYLYYLRGEYPRALHLYRESRDFCTRVGDAYHGALCDLDQAEIYLDLRHADDAEKLGWQALAEFEKLGLGYEAAKSLAFVGLAAIQKGNLTQALELLEAAQERFIEQQNSAWPALLDLYRALSYLRDGRLFEARRNADFALTFFSHSRLPGNAVLAQLLRSTLHLRADQPMEARYWADAARYTAEKSGSSSLIYLCEYVLGTIQESNGAIADAQESYQRSAKALESLTAGQAHDESKVSFLDNKSIIYEAIFATWTASAQGELRPESQTAVFDLVQSIKFRQKPQELVLFDLSADKADGKYSALAQRVTSLREEMNWLQRRITVEELRSENMPANIRAMREKARANETALIKTLEKLQVSGEMASGASSDPVTLARLRNRMPPHSSLLEYFEVRGILYVCLITHETLRVFPLTPSSRVKRMAQLLREQFSRCKQEDRPEPSQPVGDRSIEMLRTLYSELVAPVRDILRGDRLIVAPCDAVQGLPVHAFNDGTRYVAEDFAVSYAANANDYARIQRSNQTIPVGSIVLELFRGIVDPEKAGEASVIASMLPDSKILSPVTLEDLRADDWAAKLIHIVQLPAAAAYPRIGAGFAAPVTSAAQLAQVRILCDLIVLGNPSRDWNVTGGGKELLQLSRDLIRAGAPTVLSGLWSLPDVPRLTLLRSFYGLLATGVGCVVALQAAMLSLRETHPHPYHWAAFILSGRPDSTWNSRDAEDLVASI